jgi:hypothetical protein
MISREILARSQRDSDQLLDPREGKAAAQGQQETSSQPRIFGERSRNDEYGRAGEQEIMRSGSAMLTPGDFQ